MSTPATRSLPAVLRTLTEQDTGLRLVIGQYAAVQPTDARYVNVVVNGATVRVPNLNAQPAAPGQVCYLLADDTHLIAIGTVRGA